ncbi:Protein of unknown function [Chitinophaga sp. YR573]|nr:Protein of unknown function [Chitinophaga sp. YR573]
MTFKVYLPAYNINMKYNKYLNFALLIIAVFYAIRSASEGHDFEVFVYAGGKILKGQNIYTPPFVQNLQYYYSPLFALLLSPFSYFLTIVPQLLWITLSYFLLYRIWNLSKEYFDVSVLSPKQMRLWLILSAFFALRFILIDIGYVQMTTLMLWATLESIRLIRRNHHILGAALLAFVINIKLLPLPFVAYLIYRKEFKTVFFIGVFYLVYLFLPAFYLGWQGNLDLVHQWFAIINPLNKEWTAEVEDGPSSLVALIPVYLMETQGTMPFKRNFVNLPFEQVMMILNIVRLAVVLLFFAFLRTLPFRKIETGIRQYWEMCYLFLVIPLLYPHQQQYAFLYTAPVFIYLSYYFIVNWTVVKEKMNIFLWILLGIAVVSFTPIIGRDVISGYAYEVLLHYRILPMAGMLFIPVLLICKPGHLQKTA